MGYCSSCFWPVSGSKTGYSCDSNHMMKKPEVIWRHFHIHFLFSQRVSKDWIWEIGRHFPISTGPILMTHLGIIVTKNAQSKQTSHLLFKGKRKKERNMHLPVYSDWSLEIKTVSYNLWVKNPSRRIVTFS